MGHCSDGVFHGATDRFMERQRGFSIEPGRERIRVVGMDMTHWR